MPGEPDAVELRVVACLVEKQRTTPDVYPLSLNSLRLACNQSTNRSPVVDYDEATVSEALRRTAVRGWTRLASGAGSRARKYRHLLPEALGVDGGELALLAVLMLRGAQTPGELKGRTERLEGFADLAAVQEGLERLIERGYVVRHPRRPGQKEDRYEQALGGAEDEAGGGMGRGGERGGGSELGGEPEQASPAPPDAAPPSASSAPPSAPQSGTAAPSATAPQSAAPPARSTFSAHEEGQDDRGAGTGRDDDRGVENEVARLDRLEAELLELKGELARLREALGE